MPSLSDFRARLSPRHLPHRPPLSPRFWVYSASAYLIPVIIQVALPEDPGIKDELVWLVTLTPAFLLSLHYGLKGAMIGLVMGTTLFLVVQTVVAVNFTPDDWHITVPIYIAYGTLAISVGWLSEEIHKYYQRALKNERMAGIGQMALAIRTKSSDSLSVIVAQSELLEQSQESLSPKQLACIEEIRKSALSTASDIQKITNLDNAPVVELGGRDVVDIAGSIGAPAWQENVTEVAE